MLSPAVLVAAPVSATWLTIRGNEEHLEVVAFLSLNGSSKSRVLMNSNNVLDEVTFLPGQVALVVNLGESIVQVVSCAILGW